MKIQINIVQVKKHIAKFMLALAIILSVWLASARVLLLTLSYADSLQFLHFILLVGGVGGIFALYRRKNKPWIFIITTTAALFNYFFIFVLGSTWGVYITAATLIGAIVWNVILDRAPDSPVAMLQDNSDIVQSDGHDDTFPQGS